MSDKKIITKLEKEFDYVSSKITEMRTAAEEMSADSRDRFNREVDGLKARVDRMRTEFEEAKGSEGGVWDTLKDKFQTGLEDIKKSFKAMQERFK